jgi:cytosine/uracil/thiamine/allantoin permease
MHNKSARLSTIIFVGVFLLPLIGLLIMDYQVKKANDITGAYAYNTGSSYDPVLAGVIMAGIGVAIFAVFTVARFRKARSGVQSGASTVPNDINAKIGKIDDELRKF